MNSDTTIKWGPIGLDVYNRTYSRKREDGTFEQWSDTVDRVVRGSTSVGKINRGEAERLAELIGSFKMLPAGRHLWITGTGLPFTRNCFRAPWSTRLADHFEFMADQLLTGGGVGANYSQEYISQSPRLRHFDLFVTCNPMHPDYAEVRQAAGIYFVDGETVADQSLNLNRVPDMREGWAEGWGAMFDVATSNIPSVGYDVSDIRPAGAEIKTFGGTASGPGPFVRSLVSIAEVLNSAEGRHLTSVEAMLCDHHIASAVVAGGARRSARMSIVHWRDPQIMEFIKCKSDHMHHWTTNISVEIDEEFLSALRRNDPHAEKVFNAVVEGMWLNGEPGFTNTEAASVGELGDVRSTNPCGEIFLEEGESCNIGSVDLDAYGQDDEGAEEAFRLMARFLIRATLIKPYQEITAAVESRNRRIGVGFLGLQGWAAAHGVAYADMHLSKLLASKLERFRKAIRQEADRYCDELGIARCVKVTAIAPNGTISQLRGTQPGLHAVLAKYAWRRVRYTYGDPRISEALDRGLLVEPCIYAENTAVVRYPLRDTILDAYDESIVQDVNDVSLDDQLAVLAWVTRFFCDGTDGNAVSFTANLDREQLGSINNAAEIIRKWLPCVKGLTVFPSESRPQSPYEVITRDQYEAAARGEAFGGAIEMECANGACPVK
jgi:ribonucleoside-triphosphate reductase (thioredoxin)